MYKTTLIIASALILSTGALASAPQSNIDPMQGRHPYDPRPEDVRKKMQEKKEADQSANSTSQQADTPSQSSEPIKRKGIARHNPSQQMSSQNQ